MTDMSLTIAPRSDQLNSDDLIAGPRTIKITRVSANPDSAEQPISVFFEGDGGKPYKPCKSMRRVMVTVWGADGNAYVGRSMTLYRDAEVAFGGMKVGGTRISHMSEITAPQTMALTATRTQKKPYTVKPLVQQRQETRQDRHGDAAVVPPEALDAAHQGTDAFRAWCRANDAWRDFSADDMASLKTITATADRKRAELQAADPFDLPPTDEDMARAMREAADAVAGEERG